MLRMLVSIIGKAAFLMCCYLPALYGDEGGSVVVRNRAGGLDFGYEQYRPVYRSFNRKSGLLYDARGAKFVFNNSKNPNPVHGYDCRSGNDEISKYPIIIENVTDSRWVGGHVQGFLPLHSYWESTYCNGAAYLAYANVVSLRVSNLRVDGAWDGIRMSEGSGGDNGEAYKRKSVIDGVWLSNIRDDCIENDDYSLLDVKNSLLDGCFSGISMDAGRHGCKNNIYCVQMYSNHALLIDGLLLRMRAFKHKQSGIDFNGVDAPLYHQAFIKLTLDSPTYVVSNSVFAFDFYTPTYRERIVNQWRKISDCNNNYLLWMSDLSFPKDYPLPPSCFTIIKGAEARVFWGRVKSEWLNRHKIIFH